MAGASLLAVISAAKVLLFYDMTEYKLVLTLFACLHIGIDIPYVLLADIE